MALDPRSPFSSSHPLAGKISAGVRTTANRARRANVHQSMDMQQMPVLTVADRAQQMFSLDDKKGTRVYYANTGVFNTVDDKGSSINFIKGLFKTTDRQVMRFLQYFVDRSHIDYLELEEDAHDVSGQLQEQPERSDGGSSGDAGGQPDQPEPEHRDEPAAEADRSGAGGEGQEHAEQPSEGPASSEQPAPPELAPKKPSALDLIRRAKK